MKASFADSTRLLNQRPELGPAMKSAKGAQRPLDKIIESLELQKISSNLGSVTSSLDKVLSAVSGLQSIPVVTVRVKAQDGSSIERYFSAKIEISRLVGMAEALKSREGHLHETENFAKLCELATRLSDLERELQQKIPENTLAPLKKAREHVEYDVARFSRETYSLYGQEMNNLIDAVRQIRKGSSFLLGFKKRQAEAFELLPAIIKGFDVGQEIADELSIRKAVRVAIKRASAIRDLLGDIKATSVALDKWHVTFPDSASILANEQQAKKGLLEIDQAFPAYQKKQVDSAINSTETKIDQVVKCMLQEAGLTGSLNSAFAKLDGRINSSVLLYEKATGTRLTVEIRPKGSQREYYDSPR